MIDIHPSARRHHIADDDIRHAVLHWLWRGNSGWDPERILYLGPNTIGNMLEVITIGDRSPELAIHAMPMRTKYKTRLDRRGRR